MGMRLEPDERACRILLVRHDGRVELPALWLRERSPDAAHIDPASRQRLFDPHFLPEDLALTDVRAEGDTLTLAFNDGYVGRFSASGLLASIDISEGLPTPVAWTAGDTPGAPLDWPAVRDSDETFLAALQEFLTYGFVILRDTPTEPHAILDIAKRFGHVGETNFGRLFEVYSRPDSNDLAYRALALSPHTDNPYREPVPGIQLLHCLVNETSGGLSTLVDGLAVSDALRAEAPGSHALLATILVGFRFIDASNDHFARRPMIHLDRNGAFEGIHYSPRLDVTPLLAQPDLLAFHRARRRLGELLADPAFERRFLLGQGELMMFDNNRVLHGRTGYDPQEGHRHLQGCYIDREGPRSHYRVLTRRSTAAS